MEDGKVEELVVGKDGSTRGAKLRVISQQEQKDDRIQTVAKVNTI